MVESAEQGLEPACMRQSVLEVTICCVTKSTAHIQPRANISPSISFAGHHSPLDLIRAMSDYSDHHPDIYDILEEFRDFGRAPAGKSTGNDKPTTTVEQDLPS